MTPPTLPPAALKILLISLVVFLLGTSLITFYRFGDSATDENLFVSPPTNYFVVRPLPAFAEHKVAGANVPDTIPTGMYIYRVNSPKDFVSSIREFPADSVIYVRAFYPLRRTASKLYYARVRDLRDTTHYRILENHVVVIDVTPGGASDRAGMHVFDRIVAINGRTFTSAGEADVLMRQGQSGKALDYDVIRDGTPLRLHVTLAAFGFPLQALVLSLSGLLIFATGAFVLLKRPNLIAARLVGLDLVLTGFFISMVSIRRDADMSFFVALRTFTYYASFVFLFPVSRHAAAYFPREVPEMLKPWWSIRLPYIAASLLLIPLTILMFMPMEEVFRDLILLSGTALVLGTTTGVLHLFTRKLLTPEYRRMNRVVRWGKYAAIGGMLGFSILVAVLGLNALFGFFGLFLLLIPAAYLYTIGRYRLLNLQLRVRRNIQWGFVTVLWAGLTLVMLGVILLWLVSIDFGIPEVRIRGLSVEVDPAQSTAAAANLPARGMSVLLGIGAFLLVRAVRKQGQSYIDRTYYREPTDYTRAVASLSEVLSKRLSMTELGRGMVLRLAEILHLKQGGALFFREDGSCCCTEAIGVGTETWRAACDPDDRTLVGQLSRLPGESGVEYLPAPLKDRFRSAGFRFVIPIRSKERLVGALLLGEKQSEASYTAGELEFLSAAARQSSVAIENAFLYEELAEKERMETELQIARRIQLASLPQRTPDMKAFDVAAVSLPALEVGGDFFDYLIEGEQRLTVIVGDVSGKGTSAALYMSKVQGILRSLHEFRLSPGQMFIRANRLLAADMAKNSFVTAVGARFSSATRSVTVARAGHLPVYVFRAASRTVERITPRGLGLALDENRKFVQQLREERLRFAAGDVFLFISDGVVEAHDAHGEEYSETRLQAALRAAPGKSAAEIRDALLSDLEHFLEGREREDDSTIVVVRILGRRRVA